MQYGGHKHGMVKELICWKVAGFYYLLKLILEQETNTLRVGNNIINYDLCFVNNFQWYTLVN